MGEIMSARELITDAADRLGLEDVKPLTTGGQKIVLSGTLAGAPAVAKIVIVPDGPSGLEVIRRAVREVDLLGAVDSPHVVRVLTDAVEVGNKPDAICWAEERLSGSDLSANLDPPWTEDRAWQLLTDGALGLSACHELSVVHRDLSPGNVRLTDEDRFVLMDPGLARHLEKTALTGVFQPGTAGFMSPEHVPGGKPLPASDVFVLGVLTFRALTGVLPIQVGASGDEYFNRLRDQSCPDLHDHRADLSNDLRRVVNECLNKQPARRYLDGTELFGEIRRIRGDNS
ncbi:serine/threonine protein kinase [Mycobacteroides chelonae]|uniref:non-specific serine/threonine protein kinase n=2 Tax=Mycobacteroides chelonae TaxID=1774 RepID=A0A1S1M2T5_MYCCH|nr:serine/threonine-protein kinase [Mycobacteroides chelonae]OHU77921.1 hypothetical protein BKG84_05485 [Mycobacteroides chelonae]QQG86905.1 serine/threonine protein kinase [Mycobacteroides chelonae]QQG91721.1 serine/threonine protein kinase [Mycobacteroides chelonae]